MSGVNLPLDLVVRLRNPTMDWMMAGGRLGPSYYYYLQCSVSSQIDPNSVLTTVWFGGSHQERLKAGAKLDNIYYLLIISQYQALPTHTAISDCLTSLMQTLLWHT